MKQNEPIVKVMSEDVVTCRPIDKFSEVKTLIESSGVRHLPVVEGKKLVGVLSRLDVLKASFSNAYATEGADSDAMLDKKVTAKDLMTKDIVSLKDTDTVKHAAKLLASNSFHSLPVLNAGGDLVGVVTTTDLIQYLLDQY